LKDWETQTHSIVVPMVLEELWEEETLHVPYWKKTAKKAMEGIVFGGWGTDRKGNVDLGEAPTSI